MACRSRKELGIKSVLEKKKFTLPLKPKVSRKSTLQGLEKPSCSHHPSETRHHPRETGYTVNVADLLFTPERTFLESNNGKVRDLDLKGKSILLFIVPGRGTVGSDGKWLAPGRRCDWTALGDALDMAEAYNELLHLGTAVEFVFVPVQNRDYFPLDQDTFTALSSSLPFPAVPFSDAPSCGARVVRTFSLDTSCMSMDDFTNSSFWVLIDPSGTVVATRSWSCDLFKFFTGEELHPLSQDRIRTLQDSLYNQSSVNSYRAWCRDRSRTITSKWDQLLASPTRDFLLSSNGAHVPISSLKGKQVVGLYFCENVPHPPRIQSINKVYREAKSMGYDFEIVQINFHFHCFKSFPMADTTVKQCCEDVSWLTLPFKDPSCRKLYRIFHWAIREHDNCSWWNRDCLVFIYPRRKVGDDEVCCEFAGAEILERWGIDAYPFTPSSVCKAEEVIHKRDLTLRSLFPLGTTLFRPRGSKSDNVRVMIGKRVLVYDNAYNARVLTGKKVLVYFGGKVGLRKTRDQFISRLRSLYGEQCGFEVVYVDVSGSESRYEEATRDMPWLVTPYIPGRKGAMKYGVFRSTVLLPAAVAYNEDGVLIAKEHGLDVVKAHAEGYRSQFPFIYPYMDGILRGEVEYWTVWPRR